MKTIADFIIGIKRKCRYGDYQVVSDQATLDIIRSMNYHKDKIVRTFPWDWLIEPLTLNFLAGTSDYTLPATVDSILAIDSGEQNYLRKSSFKEYLKYKDSQNINNDQGSPLNYIIIGRDSTTGARKIRVWPTPTEGSSKEYFTKKTFPDWSDSDIAAGTTFLPMPDNIVDVLESLVSSDVYEIQGDAAKALASRASAKTSLDNMIRDSQADPSDDSKSTPPEYLVNKRRGRGRTKVI